MSAPHLGLLLPTRGLLLGEGGVNGRESATSVLDLAERAEALGFDSVWAGDSLVAKPRLEPLATLAAVAARTTHVRLGTSVLLAPLRPPVLLAQTAAAVDVLSGGRLDLGVGVGGAFNEAQRNEWLAAGVDPKERGARMTEIVRLCKRLWTEDGVTHEGRFHTVRGASLNPKPVQAGGVPLLLASHLATGGEAQYRRAGRYADGVIGISDSPEDFAEVLRRVRGHAEAAERDPDALRAIFYVTVNIRADEQAATAEADDFIRRYYGLNFWADKWGPFAGPEAVARRLAEYAEAGAQEIVVRFASFDQQGQAETFISNVAPIIREAHVPNR